MTNEEAIKKIEELCEYKGYNYTIITDKDIEALRLAIKALEERPKGEWIECNPLVEEKYMLDGNEYFQCSECHCCCRKKHNFCPNCGADMRGDV